MRTIRVRLWRWRPFCTRTVTLHQITVQGFFDLLRIWFMKASAQRLTLKRDLTGADLLASDSREEFVASADLLASGAEPEWLRGWTNNRNIARLMAASCRIHNWPRIFSTVNLSGKKKSGPGLMGDVMTMAQICNTDPVTVLNWPMEQFLGMCDALSASMKHAQYQDDPTLDPNAEASDSLNLPGLPVIH